MLEQAILLICRLRFHTFRILCGALLFSCPALGADDLPAPDSASLFDLWLAERGNQIPFPFETLVEEFSKTHKVEIAVVPFGRSLQKRATDLLDPRLVLALTEPKSGSYSRLPLLNKLYIGYAKNTDTLEIISYNERQSRFEFQLVKDYTSGKKPELYYANRGQCVSCHQNEAPRFSVFPWTDTHEDHATTLALRKLHPSGVYEGVDIAPHSGQSQAAAIDVAIHQRSSALVNLQILWQEGCGNGSKNETNETKDGRSSCRQALLRALLKFRQDGVLSNQHSKDVLLQINNQCSTPKLSFPTSELSNVNVAALAVPDFALITADSHFGPEHAAELAAKVHSSMIPAKHNPLRAMARIGISCQMFPRRTHSNFILSVIKDGAEALLPEHSWQHLQTAYQQAQGDQARHQNLVSFLTEHAQFMNALSSHDVLSFENFLDHVRKYTNWETLPASYNALYQQVLPPRLVNSAAPPEDDQTLSPEKLQVLALFKTYCAACHMGPGEGPLAFMRADNDVQRWHNIVTHPNILKRLSWETLDDLASAMPPAFSRPGRALRSSSHAQDRFKMLDAILSQ